jgi:hypothetical protein
MESNREALILFWGSGVCWGMTWIFPMTPHPGYFFIPLITSFLFLFLGTKVNSKMEEVIGRQSKEEKEVEAEDIVGVPV